MMPKQATLHMAAVRIGAALVGIAAGAVERAVPVTDRLTLLPRRRSALCGVLDVEGRMVPVVDLARWVEVGPATCGAHDVARILLLREGARSIGLRVDAVQGLTEVAAADMMRLHRDDDPEEVFHTVVRTCQGGAVLSVLEVGRLIELAAAWHQEDAATPADAPDPDTRAAEGMHDVSAPVVYGVMQVAGKRLGVPVANLAEVVQSPPLQRPGFGLVSCLWRARHVPVLAPARLGVDVDGAQPALVAMIEHCDLTLGIAVDRVLGMAPFAVPADAPPGPDGFGRTCYDAEGQPVLLLDIPALLARFPEAALGRSGAAAGQPGPAKQAKERVNSTAYIVFEADGLAATPIDGLEEILPLPADVPGRPLAATLAWRGKAIALADLRPLANPVHPGSPGLVVVMFRDGLHCARIITHVHLIIPPHTGRLFRMSLGDNELEFIHIGEGADQASYRTVRL